MSNATDASSPITLFWFRRDLRLADNAGLYHALRESGNVLPIFIFDTDILDRLENKKDRRISFIHGALVAIQHQLQQHGTTLLTFHGKPIHIFKELVKTFPVKAVYTNGDYEPAALKRDQEIKEFLQQEKIAFCSFKDQVIFEKNEVLKEDGTPYSVYTPYMRKWKGKLKPFYYKAYPTHHYFHSFSKRKPSPILTLNQIGFQTTDTLFSKPDLSALNLNGYEDRRNLPAIDATSHYSVHLRFGTISIREAVQLGLKKNETWLNELIWREFFMMILYHFPNVVDQAFKAAYDQIRWSNDELFFQRWREGKTGIPLVDAGMRELNETGYMHNRVRMVTASFLVKNLLIDWRWGEAYFAEKLLDFDLSANNGNWQWAAGCGCDAAPYFRIFNPIEQAKKFDPQSAYIRKWVPEVGSAAYPLPIVDLKNSRERAIQIYKSTLEKARN